MEEQPSDEATKPYAGLRGRELVQWALGAGETCQDDLGSTQTRYFQAIARRVGVKWPDGFFESSVEQLMDSNH